MTQERVTHWPSMRKCPFCNTFNPDWVTILLDYPEGGASTTIRRPFFFIDESFTDRKISLSNREWIQSIYKNFTYLKIHFHLINRAYSSTFSKFQSHRLQISLLSIPFPPPSIPNEKRRFALKYDSILARSTGWRCERISPDPLPSPTPSRNYTQPPSYARVAMHARRPWV